MVDAVIAVSSGYLNPDGAAPDTDTAVKFLASALSAADAEVTANRIGLLMQACDATAGLIGNSLARTFGSTDAVDRIRAGDGNEVSAQAVDEVVAATLRDDPPVRRTRRLRPGGEVLLIDITRLTFGAGRRPCPGPDHATALTAGVLDAILPACVLADPAIPTRRPGTCGYRPACCWHCDDS